MTQRIKGITIEIDGDTKGLDKALGGITKQTVSVNKELRDVNKLLKLDPGNSQLIAQKQTLLAKQVQNTRDKLTQLKAASKQVDDQFKAGKIPEEQYRAFQREVASTEQELNKYEGELKEVNSAQGKSAKSADDTGSAFSRFKKMLGGAALVEAGQAMQGVSQKAMELGKNMLNSGMEYQQAQRQVVRESGLSGKAADDLKKRFKDLSSQGVGTFEELSTIMGPLAGRIGASGPELDDLTIKVRQLSKVSGVEAKQSIQSVADATMTWGLKSQDVAPLLDSVAAASKKGGINAGELLDVITKNQPAMSAMGLSASEAAQFVANLANSGVTASQSVTGLNKANVYAQKSGKDLSSVIGDFQAQVQSGASDQEMMNTAVEIFGSKVGPKMFEAAKKGALNIEELSKQAEKSKGQMDKVAESSTTAKDTFDKFGRVLHTAIADTGDNILKSLQPLFEKLTPIVGKLGDFFGKLPTPIKIFIGVLTGLLAILPPLAIAIGSVSLAMGALNISLAPLILIVAAVAAAITLVIVVIKNWGSIADWIGGVFRGLGNVISTVWNGIKNVISTVVNAIKSIITTVFNAIKTYVTTVFNVYKTIITTVWNAIKSVITGVVNAIKSVVTSVFNAVKNTVSSIFNGVKNTVSNIWNGIKNAISNPINAAKNTVSNVVNGIKNTVSNIFNGVKNTVSNIWNGMKSAITNPISSAADTVRNLVDKIKGFFQFDFHWPNIPLPHFSATGSFNPVDWIKDGKWPKISVDWYAKGGVFTKPTMFATGSGMKGVGEAGPEAVLPLNGSTLAGIGSGIAPYINQGSTDDSKLDRIADLLEQLISSNQSMAVTMDGQTVGNIVSATVLNNQLTDQRMIDRGIAGGL